MNVAAIVVTAVGTLLASLCAAADGALLSFEHDEPLPPALDAMRARRERLHRALAFARACGQLLTGIGVAWLLVGSGYTGFALAGLAAVAAILLVSLSESWSRSSATPAPSRC